MAHSPTHGGTRTIGQLCARLGPGLMKAVAAPVGFDVEVGGVSLHDPREPLDDGAGGQLLLAVGVGPGDAELEQLVRAAAAAGAVGLACRGGGAWAQPGIDAALDFGITLLEISPRAGWGEIYELTRAAIAVDRLEAGTEALDSELQEASDLTSICEALAAVAGGTVGIDDMHGRVLAFSGGESDPMRTATILNHRVPEEWRKEMRRSGVMDQLLESDDVIRINLDDLEPRRAIAIRFGRTFLGSIWLLGSDDKLAEDADQALRRAAPLAALQVMRQQLVVGVERRTRESSVKRLLWGEANARTLEQMGLPVDQSLVVVALEILSRSSSSPAALGSRVTDLLSMHLHASEQPFVATFFGQGRGRSAAVGERIYAIVASRGDADRRALRRLTGECLLQASKTIGVHLQAGIGHEVDPAGDLTLGRRSAEDCLALRSAPDAVVAFEEVYDQALTADVDDLVADWRGGPSVAYRALLEHDQAHGTEYVLTLRCMLDSFGSTSAVARRLHLHVNTVRYRIRRIAEITSVQFTDSDARLALELALRSHTRTSPKDG